jgi:hypothetical protein
MWICYSGSSRDVRVHSQYSIRSIQTERKGAWIWVGLGEHRGIDYVMYSPFKAELLRVQLEVNIAVELSTIETFPDTRLQHTNCQMARMSGLFLNTIWSKVLKKDTWNVWGLAQG